MAATLADHVPAFLDDMARVIQLRPHTLRAYRYELIAAAVALTSPLDQLTLAELERWASSGAVAPSTIAHRTATLSRFFTWAVRHQLCTAHPLASREPARRRQRLPRPIENTTDRTALEKAIAAAPQPYQYLRRLPDDPGRLRTLLPLLVERAPGRRLAGRADYPHSARRGAARPRCTVSALCAAGAMAGAPVVW